MPRINRIALCAAALALVSMASSACRSSPPSAQQAPAAVPEQETPAGRRVGIAFLGDSITAGLGLFSQEAYPAILEEMFQAEGYTEVNVTNAGISGDTTAGGLRRVHQAISGNAEILVVALGGNDALRGLTVAQTYDNLAGIVEEAQGASVDVLLVGMQAPTNLGEDYQLAFRAVFGRVARDYAPSVKFIPFLLEGVAGVPELNQQDGIHPAAAGARKIAELLYPKLRDMVDQRLGAGGGGAPHE